MFLGQQGGDDVSKAVPGGGVYWGRERGLGEVLLYGREAWSLLVHVRLVQPRRTSAARPPATHITPSVCDLFNRKKNNNKPSLKRQLDSEGNVVQSPVTPNYSANTELLGLKHY